MKTYIIFALLAVAMAAQDIDYYAELLDDLDPEALVNDSDRFQSYLDCFKGVKPCSEVAHSYKVSIPEALAQACKRCSPARKQMARRFLETLKEKDPNEYELLKQILDPENKYYDDFIKAVSQH